MSYYRNVYLKSEHWKTLRIAKLAKSKAVCACCQKESIYNDVHHVSYGRSLYEVEKKDLRVLCRDCHDLAHLVLKEFPEIRTAPKEKRWALTVQRMHEKMGRGGPRPPRTRWASNFWVSFTADRLNQARTKVGCALGIKIRRRETPISPELCRWIKAHPFASDAAVVALAGRLANPAFSMETREPQSEYPYGEEGCAKLDRRKARQGGGF